MGGTGIVKFVGSLLPTKSGKWIGIERDCIIDPNEPKPNGFNGKLGDLQYFECKKSKGIFVPNNCVKLLIKTKKKSSKKPIDAKQLAQKLKQRIKNKKIEKLKEFQKKTINRKNITLSNRTAHLLKEQKALSQRVSLQRLRASKTMQLMQCRKYLQFKQKSHCFASLMTSKNCNCD